MQTNEWYYECKGTRIGPVSTSDLKRLRVEGILKGETLVWADGMEDWCPAGTVDSLKEILAVALPPAVGVTDSGIRADQLGASKIPFLSELNPRHRLLLFASAGVLVLCILGAAGYFLMVRRAPHQGMSSEDHFEALVEKYKELRTTMGYSVVRAGKGVCPDNDDLFLQVISTDPEYQQESAAVMQDMKLESLPEDDSLESIRVRSTVQKEVRLRLARKEREILSAQMEPHKAARTVSRMLGGDLELRNALMADLPPLPAQPNPFTQPTTIGNSSPNPKAASGQPFVPASAGQAQSPPDSSPGQQPANPAVAPPAVLPAASRTTEVPVGLDNPVVPQEPAPAAKLPTAEESEPLKASAGSVNEPAGTGQEDGADSTKNARAFLTLANQFAKAGQTEQANAYARKVIEVAPDSPEAREARTMLGLKEPTPPESAETRPNPPSGEQKPVQTPAVEEKRLTAADIPGVYNVYQDGKQIGTMELFSNGGIRNWKGWKKAEYKWSLDGTTIIMRWAKTRSAFDYTGAGKFADTTGDTKGVSIEKQK